MVSFITVHTFKERAYMFSGQEEKKNVYLPFSLHTVASFSRSKNSPTRRL